MCEKSDQAHACRFRIHGRIGRSIGKVELVSIKKELVATSLGSQDSKQAPRYPVVILAALGELLSDPSQPVFFRIGGYSSSRGERCALRNTCVEGVSWFAKLTRSNQSQEETEWNGKSDVPAKQRGSWLRKLKEKDKTAFFSLSENRCLPAPSTLKPEEREFVVDSGASMHTISKKDLNSAELETVTTSRSPVMVITANGEVQTNEEATVYVRELDIFLMMKLLEMTPAVLSLGKLCDEHGYSYEWMNGQKPHLIKNGIRVQCNTDNFVLVVVPTNPSSSSTSPPMTSSTVSSESVARQEREDPC